MLPYRVKSGDTATELAVRFHAWTAELVAINHLSSSTLYAGERVRIPVVLSAWRQARHGHPRAHHHAKRHHPRAHHHARPHHQKAHRPKTHHHARAHHHHKAHHHPWRFAGASRAKVRRAVLRQAHRRHVSPTLALAIAWQESGWQQHRLSSAHAIGAMQVLPATGRWLESYVDRPLNLYGLHDNARAGVVLLDILRGQTGLRRTVAGYYQGLASVRAFGMYDSTRAYVRNVLAIRKRLAHGWNPA
jgi:LysM repeat protein